MVRSMPDRTIGDQMKEIGVYQLIQDLRQRGFSRNAVVARTGVCWRTVDKYWDMSLEEYEKREHVGRPAAKALGAYDDVVVQWLREWPDMTAAQVLDWIVERYGTSPASERTVRRHVAELREDYGIPRSRPVREYEAVPELPFGHQTQVDFGCAWMTTATGGRVQVRFSTLMLSRSRMRWGHMQSRPYRSSDLVRDMWSAFAFFGGRTEEYVFDQDAVLCVTENAGDVIMTREMEALRQNVGFSVSVCHGADPETKGKIENTVRYVKRNFLAHRTYPGSDEALNEEFAAWLGRTGNAKPNGTTKVAPGALFELERPRLVPVAAAPVHAGRERRRVRKDNTVVFRQNRYSLPLGTYDSTPEVAIEVIGGRLSAYSPAGDLLAEHEVSEATGVLVQKSSHRHDRTTRILREMDRTMGLLGETRRPYLERMCAEHPRYECDQLALVCHAWARCGGDATTAAIDHCWESGLFSANDVLAWAEAHQGTRPATSADLAELYGTRVAKRDLADYRQVV